MGVGKRTQKKRPPGLAVATVNDVAERAGVSTATVSRVLSGSETVSPQLAERVREAARKLRYQPNRIARNLRSREVRSVGVLIPDFENSFFTAVISGIEEILSSVDYTILLTHHRDDEGRESRVLDTLAAEGVAGILFTVSGNQSPEYARLAATGLPMVAVSRVPTGMDVDLVGVDDRSGARDAVNHLLKLGHKRIAFINGPLSVSTARDRDIAYREALACAGIPVRAELMVNTDWRHSGRYAAMRQILALADRPTALFSGSNLITLGALQAIQDEGLQIPRDMAVVGFDDVVWAASLRPPLTAVARPAVEIGRNAARMLLARIENPDAERKEVRLPAELIVRSSCGWQWKL